MPRREISRREFLQSFVGRRQPVPHVDQEHCYTNMGCSLCSTACPVGALTGNKTALSLDSDKCTGCGICVSVCPWQALRLPPFNTSEIEAELGALLSQAEALPITVVFTCRCSHTGWRSMMSPLPVSPGLVESSVPCLGMVSVYLLVRALTLGAHRILLATMNSCHYGLRREELVQRVDVVRHILESWHDNPERLQIINVEHAKDASSQTLPWLDCGQGGKPVFAGLDPSRANWQHNHLGSLLRQIALRLPLAQAQPLTNRHVPLAIAQVDTSLCSLCGLCADRCPAGAITVTRGRELELVFRYDKCVGCGACESVCPEKCLRLTQTLDPSRLRLGNELLCRSEAVICRLCGSPFIPQRVAARVLQTAFSDNVALADRIRDLCPTCRPMTFFR